MKRFIFGDQIDIFDLMYSPYKIKKPIRLIELFAGIGAQAAALRNIGANFERYRVVEFDKYAIASYNAIHGTDFPVLDVTQIHGADLGIVDTDKFEYLLTYSFPCTDLSIRGRMQGMDEGSGTRSSLLWEVRRLLDECDNLPQCLLMENVPQVHSEDNMPNFCKWLKYLEVKGYTSYWQERKEGDKNDTRNQNRTNPIRRILGAEGYQRQERREKGGMRNGSCFHADARRDRHVYDDTQFRDRFCECRAQLQTGEVNNDE